MKFDGVLFPNCRSVLQQQPACQLESKYKLLVIFCGYSAGHYILREGGIIVNKMAAKVIE